VIASRGPRNDRGAGLAGQGASGTGWCRLDVTVGACVAALALVLAALWPSPAEASHRGCGLLGMAACAHAGAPPAAPDPGGSEGTDVRLPPPDRRFGFNSQLAIGLTTPEQEVGLGRVLRSTLQRYPVAWGALQPTAGSPVLPSTGSAKGYLTNLDELYAELVSQGMTPVLTFLRAPLWATDYDDCGTLDRACKRGTKWSNQHPNWAHVGAFARFVGAIAARYPGAVIEPWNEPNIKPFWRPDAPNPRLYTAMQCAAYDAVKRLPTPNFVTSAGLGAHSRPRADDSPFFGDYLETVYSAGIRSCMDALNVHVYGANVMDLGAGSPFAEEWAIIRAARARHGDTTKIWVTETGTTTVPDSIWVDWGVTEAEQAQRNAGIYNRLATMDDVAAIAFHTLRDAPNEHQTGNQDDPGYHYGFLRADYSPKPVFCEFARKASSAFPGC